MAVQPDASPRASRRRDAQRRSALLRGGKVRLLEADLELGDTVSPGERAAATLGLTAPAAVLTRGYWEVGPKPPADARVGVLLLRGLICRDVVVDGSASGELLGPGDLLRPWNAANVSLLLPHEVRWHVFEEAKVAFLGEQFCQRASRWPAVTVALLDRTVSRSHARGVAAAIASATTGLDARLLMLFRHFGARWGKVVPGGVLLELELTHETIAHIVGARRPSVTTCLRELEREGRITRVKRHAWLLPPQTTGDVAGERGDRSVE